MSNPRAAGPFLTRPFVLVALLAIAIPFIITRFQSDISRVLPWSPSSPATTTSSVPVAQPSSTGSPTTQPDVRVLPDFDYSREEDITRYSLGGYHPVNIGDGFKDGRYVVRRKIGYGEFSTVWLAEDIQVNEFVALKILTGNSTEGGIDEVDEINLLLRASTADVSHPGHKHVIGLRDHFYHVGPHGKHICLVFDMLGRDIYALLQHYDEAVPMNIIKSIIRQIFLGLDYLHTACGIVHTDLKLDNVLLTLEDPYPRISADLATNPPQVSPKQTSEFPPYSTFSVIKTQPLPVFVPSSDDPQIKIVDLGVANWVGNHLRNEIQSLALRSPEALLRAPWETPVDIWSVACVIYYLMMGTELFNPWAQEDPSWSTEEELLAQMIEYFGPVPQSLVKSGKYSTDWLADDGMLLHVAGIEPHANSLHANIAEFYGEEEADDLMDLLGRMFRYEPETRATAAELAKHPWLNN
ncbi:kinase-like protein [Coniophora puteana RWD-64-598 SS2]|uniref:non-specific serine/threonine protein kinase n=1 Tax=Coniophora puteana (strain RWD-64-598) TaxID=741705 RepID=A0A5M3MXQ7_CONPW|nr:kinase-like protein [Coniophora puteana RWD-64-598 SS2]EIW83797.1 kinase-like protein [Coniophora puteana RWD-64-598 SS2]